ncbi:MAG: hypothetical protein JXR30_01730 [Alphaproteobacteria bacterium]|nr:hypothetical protein [Alphaproteobacteria bacterium]
MNKVPHPEDIWKEIQSLEKTLNDPNAQEGIKNLLRPRVEALRKKLPDDYIPPKKHFTFLKSFKKKER